MAARGRSTYHMYVVRMFYLVLHGTFKSRWSYYFINCVLNLKKKKNLLNYYTRLWIHETMVPLNKKREIQKKERKVTCWERTDLLALVCGV